MIKYTIDAPEATHGIRVIREIPDLPLCQIEGRNGIGKTLAVHLLELCTGQQPYAARTDAWRTLCAYLGPTTVTVGGLRTAADGEAGSELRLEFDWRTLQDQPIPLQIGHEHFNTITVDGRVVDDITEVQRLLTVVRIAGDESLTDTITGIVAHDRELVTTASRIARDRAEYTDRLLARMLGPFSAEVPRRLVAVAEELRDLSSRRTATAEQRDQARAGLDRLEAALAARSIVGQVSADADALDGEIETLTTQLAAATERREEAHAELEAAQERLRLTEAASKALEKAQRLFARRLKALERADGAIEKAAAALGIGTEPEAVVQALAALADERVSVAAERADLGELFALRDLLDRLVHALAPASAGGLRARTVATVDGHVVTAGGLLDAVRARRERLSADAPAVEELDRRLQEIEARTGQLEKLRTAHAEREAKHDNLLEAEAALGQSAEGDRPADDIAERAAAHAAAQRVEIEVGTALGVAQRQRTQLGGGRDIADLRSELEQRLREANTTEATLDESLRKARGALVALDDELDTADTRRDALEVQKATLTREVIEQTRLLHADEHHSRLLGALGDSAPQTVGDAEDMARAWLVAHNAQDRAVTRLQTVRSGLDVAAGHMRDLVDVIRAKGDSTRPGLDDIRRYYQTRLEAQFGRAEILDALFDGGTITRVDLAEREIRWQTDRGEPRIRPFEAFSSGERAFAYVQARLGTMGEARAINRVVAVDEFGAFLSRDRLTRLRQAVETQLADGAIDQALVILPLGATPGAPADADLIVGPFEAPGVA